MKVIEDWRAIDVEDALKTLHTERRHYCRVNSKCRIIRSIDNIFGYIVSLTRHYLTHVDNSRNP